ncbi:hypothetical protein ACU686_38515 [Yinghuangia aomiensis]
MTESNLQWWKTVRRIWAPWSWVPARRPDRHSVSSQVLSARSVPTVRMLCIHTVSSRARRSRPPLNVTEESADSVKRLIPASMSSKVAPSMRSPLVVPPPAPGPR